MFKRAALLSVVMLFGVLLAASPAAAGLGLSPSPSQLEFGEVDLHYGGTPRQSVTFSDIDPSASVLVEAASVVGAQSANFQIVSDGCSGVLLENSKGCSIEVAFEAHGAAGSDSAALELLTSEGVVLAPLSGSFITGTLSANPSSLSFAAIPYTAPGSHTEGENNETEQLNIHNSANASTEVQSASISGADASSFSIQWNCDGDVIGTSNSCGMGIRFQPTSPGPKNASLTIVSDSATSPLVVPLTGEGLHGPQMSFNTTQALLGDVALGSSAQQTFTVTNTGDYLLFVQRAFLVSGTPLMFPVLGDSCSGQILSPAESCAITVGFQPSTVGEKSASLLFISNMPTINVAGIDGIGVPGNEGATSAQVTAPAHSHTPASPPSPTTPPPAAVAALPTGGDPAPTALASPLTALRPPRLISLFGRLTLDAGADVQCPATAHGCEALGFIVADGVSRRPAASELGHAPSLLGSASAQLRAGQGTHVHIPLTRNAIARLKRRGHMYVRVGVAVQAAGEIIAEHTWTIELTSAGAASRAG